MAKEAGGTGSSRHDFLKRFGIQRGSDTEAGAVPVAAKSSEAPVDPLGATSPEENTTSAMDPEVLYKLETFNRDTRSTRALIWFCIILMPAVILLIPFSLIHYFRARRLSKLPEVQIGMSKFAQWQTDAIKQTAEGVGDDAQLARFCLNARQARMLPWMALVIAVSIIVLIGYIYFT